MKKVIFTLLIASFISSLNAQTYTMLSKGKAGFGSNFGYVRGSGSYGMKAELAFVQSKMFGLNVHALKLNYNRLEQGLILDNSKSLSKGVSASFWFLKPSIGENSELKLGVTVGADYVTYKDYFYMNQETPHQDQLRDRIQGSLGFESLLNIRFEKNWVFQPALYFGYRLGRNAVTHLNQEKSITDDSSETVISIAFGKEFKDGDMIFISMRQFLYTKPIDNYNCISAGIAFPIGK